jgi:hypothetical protein
VPEDFTFADDAEGVNMCCVGVALLDVSAYGCSAACGSCHRRSSHAAAVHSACSLQARR